VIKAHHGTIALDSGPGHTDFTVRLPLTADAHSADTAPANSEPRRAQDD
jgi:two-component system, OmpR family, sensor kinase